MRILSWPCEISLGHITFILNSMGTTQWATRNIRFKRNSKKLIRNNIDSIFQIIINILNMRIVLFVSTKTLWIRIISAKSIVTLITLSTSKRLSHCKLAYPSIPKNLYQAYIIWINTKFKVTFIRREVIQIIPLSNKSIPFAVFEIKTAERWSVYCESRHLGKWMFVLPGSSGSNDMCSRCT